VYKEAPWFRPATHERLMPPDTRGRVLIYQLNLIEVSSTLKPSNISLLHGVLALSRRVEECEPLVSGAPPGNAAINLAEVAAEEVTMLLKLLGPKRVHVMGRAFQSSPVQLNWSIFPQNTT